jgi:hypothetical protein|tara:strand:- start:1106 stop:1384 length:279 start_codon:yes stop_codon:yes gene_type:complete
MEARFNHLVYSICNIATDLENIDFSQVGETSASTIRRSLDDTLFVIKYNVEPTFIKDGTVTPSQVLTHSQALELMATPEWTEEEPIEEVDNK